MRTLLRFTCGFLLSALCAIFLCSGLHLYLAAAVLLVLSILLCILRPRIGVALLGFALGLFWTAGYQAIFIAPSQALAGSVRTIYGEATDYSTETEYGLRVPAVIQADDVQVRAMVWLNQEQPLEPGDQFTVLACLKDACSNDTSYYISDGIHILAYGKAQFQKTGTADHKLRYLPRHIAHRLDQSLSRCVPRDALGYAMALTTGNRTALTTLQKEDLRTSGIYHALALSGLHLTVLVGSLGFWISKGRLRAWIGIPMSVAFAIVTGASPSIVRAAVMECLVLTASLIGREADPPTSLAAAGLVLTMENPYCILNWGMQLSFASMIGLILLGDRFYRAIAGRRRRSILHRIRRWIAAPLSATAAATVFTTPLMMAYFGQLSLIAPVTNLLTGWAVAWCFQGSLLTALVGLVFPILGRAMGWVTAWPIRYVQGIAGALSRVPFAALSTASGYTVGWVLLVYSLLILLLLRPKGQGHGILPGCCMAGSLGVCLFLMLLSGGGSSFTVLDVGQGQCLLALQNGQAAIIDCGGSAGSATGDMVAAELASYGIYRVEYLILTHYDDDHSAGVTELLQRIPVSTVLLPDLDPEDPHRREIEQAARAQHTEILHVTAHTKAALGSGELELIPPAGQDQNAGLAVLVEMPAFTALITGDMDTQQEQDLLDTVALPDVNLLIAGHHGSKYSTSEALLRQTAPEIVAISVGKNSYGHPADETLRRITEYGAQIYRTDYQGTIRFKGA